MHSQSRRLSWRLLRLECRQNQPPSRHPMTVLWPWLPQHLPWALQMRLSSGQGLATNPQRGPPPLRLLTL